MIIVTDGTGFIGSSIVRSLNDKGITDTLVVDNLEDGIKSVNPVDLSIVGYMDKEDFLIRIMAEEDFGDIEATSHESICSSTTEWNGEHMMDNNYRYPKELLHYCLEREVPFLYASSAATYGGRISDFIESREYERPLNVYGYSKLLFDKYVRQVLPEANSQIIGFRYFSVYGPYEGHKGSMTSVTFHLNTQPNNDEAPKLFGSSKNLKRDFIYVGDVVAVSLWFLENKVSGIFNLGTGRAESLQAVTDATLTYHKRGSTRYIPFPEKLKSCHQAFTQADLTNLCTAGYDRPPRTVTGGITEYMAWLNHDA